MFLLNIVHLAKFICYHVSNDVSGGNEASTQAKAEAKATGYHAILIGLPVHLS